jgi:predicted small integral membrane protein
MTAIRICKILLLAAIAFFFTLVAFNNLTDFDSNYQFVRHVLMMDSTFPGNNGMWRALNSRWIHTLFYGSIIITETVIALLAWWGTVRLVQSLRASRAAFQRAKSVGIAALTLGCLLWSVAFISVGGEWFLMWQSKTWNGQDAAFRMFTILGITLIYLSAPEFEHDLLSPSSPERGA